MLRRPLVLAALACAAIALPPSEALAARPTFQDPPAAEKPAAAPDGDAQRGDVPGTAAAKPAKQEIDRSRWPKLEPVEIDASAVARAIGGGPDAKAEPIRISPDELRRTLVYIVGWKELRSFKLDIDIEAEMARQIEAGRDPADFAIDEAEIEAIIERVIENARTQYPTLDPVDVLRLNKIHLGNQRRMIRQSQLFTRVFLPTNPEKWPAITVESMRAAGQGAAVDQIKAQFAELERKIAAGELTEEQVKQARQGQQTMLQMLGGSVVKALDDAAEVQTAADGLPADVAMRVNGHDITVDRVYDEIADRVTADDIELARRWTVKNTLLQRALATRGYLLDPEQAAVRYDEHLAPLRGTIFPPEFFVMQVKGFPSMQLYQQHNRLIESYRDMIASEMTPEVLSKHFNERGNDLLNVAKVGTEVILLSAYDFSKGVWKENGWADAERRAREVAQKLVESGGANWGELQDEYSDFWDPPMPTTPTQQMPERNNKGRFAPMARNELLGKLGENEFTLYLDGTSVTDELFFYTPEGSLGGPWKGRYGWYIGRVTARTAPRASATSPTGTWRR
ncbi:MAG: hypothetical protein R3F34_15310 [Planctomycetota bacterium]